MWEHLKNFRRITPYARPYRRLVVTLWVYTGLAAVVALFQPWPFAFIIDSIIGSKPAPSMLSWLDSHPIWFQLAFGVFLTLVMNLIQSAITIAAEAAGTKLELNVVLDYRSDLFEHAQQLSLTYHDGQRKGSFIYQINFHAHSAGTVYTAIPPLAQAALTLAGMFVITFHLDPSLALIASAVAPFLFFAVRWYGRYVQTSLFKVRNLEGESMSIIHESMSMIAVVVANARERYEHRKFRDQANTAITARVRLTVMQTVFSLAVSFITAIGTGLVIFYGAQAVLSERLTLGELLVVISYVAAIYRPMEQISTTVGTLQETFVNLGLSFDLLDTPIEVYDAPDALELPASQGHIVFDDVSFSYPGRPDVLRHVSFEILPGERVAIVGPTGAGKSTMMSLLGRFSDPEEGRIRLDGHDLRDLRVEDLRNRLSFVLQEPVLFKGSIATNIRYGRLDASDEDVERAAKDAGADEFIRQLPHGYHTDVGERGAQLSGGERQRVCVARAFVRDAPVLILDEPTSSIDSRTELAVLDALDRLAEGRTTLIIAHRLSTVRDADRVIVLDHGVVVESGSPEDLLAAGGLYAELAAAQGMIIPEGAADEVATLAAPVPDKPAERSAPSLAQRPKVVVLGMLTKMPVGGAVWQVIHYLVGLQRLGLDVHYVEAHARTPSMFTTRTSGSGTERATAFLSAVMSEIGLGDRWAFHALHDDGQVYGMDERALTALYRDAALIINLHGATTPRPEHTATGRLVYVETDPGELAVELNTGRPESIEFLAAHSAFFTFAENWQRDDCHLPRTDRFEFLPTRQPVVLDMWSDRGNAPSGRFTTVGNWRQHWRSVELDGETYHWSKHLEFERFMQLPSRVSVPVELALASIDDAEATTLRSAGWHVRDALGLSTDWHTYRSYIANSMGEFTVAKDQNVRLRTGWFSDRSATYLAAGRPVVTQDTGFGAVLPLGAGLFACSTLDDAAAAIEAIVADPQRHQRAATAIANDHFDHAVVLRPMLEHCGVAAGRRTTSKTAVPAPTTGIPLDLDLEPRSKRPLALAQATTDRLLALPLPPAAVVTGHGGRKVSVVIVTFGNLELTKLCLESVLANSNHPNLEVIVVDNASSDGTPAYLTALARIRPSVRPLLNTANRGFAAAANQGLEAASGDVLALLNNDVVVAPGWVHGLAGHLDDPTVAMVGPVTNAAPNEARVRVGYRTYGGFLDHATGRHQEFRRRSVDIDVLTMFCVMMSRATYRRIGPIDEGYGIGLFEDDDYSMRIRAAGLRLVCAEDTLVHHFGEAAFGTLVADGSYKALFEQNRARFEARWGCSWEPHHHRSDEKYTKLVHDVRRSLSEAIPVGESVAVAAKGEKAWLDLDQRRGVQFPAGESGEFEGWYPPDDATAVDALERLFDDGVEYVAFPSTSRWMLDHYAGLATHVAEHYEPVVDDANVVVFRHRTTAGVGR